MVTLPFGSYCKNDGDSLYQSNNEAEKLCQEQLLDIFEVG